MVGIVLEQTREEGGSHIAYDRRPITSLLRTRRSRRTQRVCLPSQLKCRGTCGSLRDRIREVSGASGAEAAGRADPGGTNNTDIGI